MSTNRVTVTATSSMGRSESPRVQLVALVLFVLLSSSCCTATELTVAVIEAEGFCTLTGAATGKNAWQGFIPDVVQELAKELKFTPAFVRVADGRYGVYEESTGSWSGLIGQVVDRKVDFAAAPLTVTAQREKHVDFSHELLDVGLVALIKRPERLNSVSRGVGFFFGIFDSGVWGSAVAVFLATSFLLHLNDRFNPREARAKMAEHMAAAAAAAGGSGGGGGGGSTGASPESYFSMLGSAFYVMSTGCFQGYERAPRSLCGRCLSLFWWLFASLFAATYTAGFLCALVASGSSQDNSFSYMDARDQYQVDKNTVNAMVPLWLPGGSTAAFMANSSEPLFHLFQQLHEAAARDDPRVAGVKTMADLATLVGKAHHFVGIVESPLGHYYARRSGCQLVVSGSLLSDKSYAFAFPERSNLTGRVNAALLRLREIGFIRRTYEKHFGGAFVACGEAVAENSTYSGSGGSGGSSSTLGLAGEELARMFRDSLPISLRTFAGPVVMYFLSLLVSAGAALMDMHIFARVERHQHQAQVLRNIHEEPVEEPNFSSLAAEEQRNQRRQQQHPGGDLSGAESYT